MDNLELQELLNRIQNDAESERIEAKKASDKVGNSTLETISGFCNEPGLGGGYLILGLSKAEDNAIPRYVVTGVKDPEKIQNELVTLCRQNFNISIRPEIDIVSHPDGKVIVAYIPEAEHYKKPVYIKSKGSEHGAFRRIGPTDQLCTRDDLDLINRLRSQKKFDETLANNGTWKDFDPIAIEAYRTYRKEINNDAKELKLSDRDLMLSLNAAIDVKNELKPTNAGIILFGTEFAIRRLFPIAARIDYIIVDGRQWVSNPVKRYSQSYEFREALILAIPRIMSHIIRDIPKAFSMQPNGIFRKDIPLIPDIVIREAVCNAVMHRDYSTAQAVQIIRYANRIEFQNPGYSLKPEDQLGLPGSITRNENISVVLHDLNIAETKGTGMRTMREAMKEANLSVPLFESDRAANKFTLTLLSHHLFGESDIRWLANFKEFDLTNEEARALIVVREMGAITNADYRNICSLDTLAASSSLRRLRDLGLLEAKGKGSQTYYVPGKLMHLTDLPTELTTKIGSFPGGLTPYTSPIPVKSCPTIDSLSIKLSHSANNSSIFIPDIAGLPTELTPNIRGLPTELTPNIRGLPTELTPNIRGLPTEFQMLPSDLQEELTKIGLRVSPAKAKSLILRLCKFKPFKLPELANLLKRNSDYLRINYIMPLIKANELEYVFPHQPNHPQQAYQTKQIGALL